MILGFPAVAFRLPFLSGCGVADWSYQKKILVFPYQTLLLLLRRSRPIYFTCILATASIQVSALLLREKAEAAGFANALMFCLQAVMPMNADLRVRPTW